MTYRRLIVKTATEKLDMIQERLARIETRMVRGFEEIGINVTGDRSWLIVSNDARTIDVNSSARSLHVIRETAKAKGALYKEYTLLENGQPVGSIKL